MPRISLATAAAPWLAGLLSIAASTSAVASSDGPPKKEPPVGTAEGEAEVAGSQAGAPGDEAESERQTQEPDPETDAPADETDEVGPEKPPERPPEEERVEQADDDAEKPIDEQLDAAAQAAAAQEQARVEAAAKAQAEVDRKRRKDQPWLERWRPERHMIELGIFGGAFLANDEHDLYDPRTAPQEPLWRAAPDVGVRLAYFPLRPLGVETEFSAVPHRVRSITNDPVFVYGFRAHAIAQLPFHSVTPFFLAGGGLLGVKSHLIVLGDDIDPAFHYGGGIKVFFNRWVGARVEARNIVSALEATQNSGASHIQVLAGLTFTFLRAKPKPLPPEPPPEDPDRDRDGFRNEVDECPDDAGVGPHGCPDTDGDGFRDSRDACPETPGIAPDGCPAKDTDQDGYNDPVDDCPTEPENYNGYQDGDGCPDELPEVVKKFTGTIEGIFFEFNEAKIRPESKPVLDDAVETLKEFDTIRVRITGHTDDVGTEEFNQELSEKRAAAVKQYLVEHGIDASRIETVGRGSSVPLVPNTSDENRAKNRRIEFQVIEGAADTEEQKPRKFESTPKRVDPGQRQPARPDEP